MREKCRRMRKLPMIIKWACTAVLIDRYGIQVLSDTVGPTGNDTKRLEAPGMIPPAAAVDQTLAAIADRYGDKTAEMVAMQLEYSWQLP